MIENKSLILFCFVIKTSSFENKSHIKYILSYNHSFVHILSIVAYLGQRDGSFFHCCCNWSRHLLFWGQSPVHVLTAPHFFSIGHNFLLITYKHFDCSTKRTQPNLSGTLFATRTICGPKCASSHRVLHPPTRILCPPSYHVRVQDGREKREVREYLSKKCIAWLCSHWHCDPPRVGLRTHPTGPANVSVHIRRRLRNCAMLCWACADAQHG